MSAFFLPQRPCPSCCGQQSPSSPVTVGPLLSPGRSGVFTAAQTVLVYVAPGFLGHVGTMQWHLWSSWLVLWVPGQCPVLGDAGCRAQAQCDPRSQGQTRPAEQLRRLPQALGLLSLLLCPPWCVSLSPSFAGFLKTGSAWKTWLCGRETHTGWCRGERVPSLFVQ